CAGRQPFRRRRLPDSNRVADPAASGKKPRKTGLRVRAPGVVPSRAELAARIVGMSGSSRPGDDTRDTSWRTALSGRPHRYASRYSVDRRSANLKGDYHHAQGQKSVVVRPIREVTCRGAAPNPGDPTAAISFRRRL